MRTYARFIALIGAAFLASSSAHAQGVARQPPPQVVELIADTGVGTANTTTGTGTLDVSKYRSLAIVIIPGGTPTAGAFQVVEPITSSVIWNTNLATAVGASKQTAVMGAGVNPTATTNGNTMSYLGGPTFMLPSVQIQTTGLGTGVTSRILVYGTR